jgi:putative nucleotidyltransferase with HDIG domain
MKILITEEQLNEIHNDLDAKKLIYSLPDSIKKRFFGLWNVPQRLDYHPEGNTLKHAIMVTKRAIKYHPDNMNIVIAALFHDIGKDETAGVNPKTGHPTAYGHEDVSAELVKKNPDWIMNNGGDPEVVYYIVKNHMNAHRLDQMKPSKQDAIKSHPNFGDLEKFEKLDKGGLEL